MDDRDAEKVVRSTLPSRLVAEFDRAVGRGFGSDDVQYAGPVEVEMSEFQLGALRQYASGRYKAMRFEVALVEREGFNWVSVRRKDL